MMEEEKAGKRGCSGPWSLSRGSKDMAMAAQWIPGPGVAKIC